MRSVLVSCLSLALCSCEPAETLPDAGLGGDAGSSMVVDAGQADAGQADAGRGDAGQVDAGQVDAGQVDAGPASQFCRDYIEAQARLQGRCGAVTDGGVGALVLGMQEQCARWPLPRRGFVSTAVAGCLQAYDDATCSTVVDNSRCDAVIPGLVQDGGACFSTGECTTGLYCDTSTTCPGVCKPHVAIGQPATLSEQCVPEAFVAGGVCVARVALGQSCASPAGQQRLECVAGGRCDSSSICVAQTLAGVGEDCESVVYPPCATGLACGGMGCVPFADEGDTCGFASGIPCKTDLFCSASVCVRPGVTGQLCSFDRPCAWTHYCDSPPGMLPRTCRQLPAVNETCGRFGECGSGLFCDFAIDRCVPLRDLGETCSFDTDCKRLTHCAPATKTCTSPKAAGATCLNGNECLSGSCVSSRCTTPSYCFEP